MILYPDEQALIPLVLGCHMNSILNLCGLSLDGQSRLYRWIARVALIEGLIHSIMELVKGLSIKSVPQIAALVVTIFPSSVLSVLISDQAASVMVLAVATAIAMVQ